MLFVGFHSLFRVNHRSQVFTYMSDRRNKLQSNRTVLIILGITLWFLLIVVRLVHLQIFEHKRYSQLAHQNQQITQSIHAPRGPIYDCHMDELAISVSVSTVVAEPRRIDNISRAAQSLAEILEIDAKTLKERMMNPARRLFVVIKRRIDSAAERRIEALGLRGVYFVDESMRVYPNGELASHTLGWVNMDGDGGAGIELEYDKVLKGKKGSYSFEIDARGRSFHVNVENPPVQGHSLVLSVDKSIQYIADRELAAGVKGSRAQAGTAIVMEPETGRILALSNYPQFDGSTYYKNYAPGLGRNRAISDIFEPGSTFKVVVAAAALESGLVRPDEMIDCQMGTIKIGGHIFHDHKPYGFLFFREVLENSSNVGAAKLGLRMGKQRLYEAIRDFGFGSKSGVDLPGEAKGLVRDWRDWSGLSIGAISFGQEVGVTSIQMIAAINAIANGGYLVRPSVVDRIIDEKGNLVNARIPERVRLTSPLTAGIVSEAFEGVVIRGTGRQAALEGYRAAGKTGTAQKIINGQYSHTKFIASFIGYAPLPKPRLTILVQIDEPVGKHYGGEVCGPIFRNIAQQALMQLHVPPDRSLPLPKLEPTIAETRSQAHVPRFETAPVETVSSLSADEFRESNPEVISMPIEGELVILPDFSGLAKRSVLDRCLDLGIHLQSSGSGVAVFQSPPPGTKIPTGAKCRVIFAKGNLKKHLAAAEEYHAAQGSDPRLSVSIQP